MKVFRIRDLTTKAISAKAAGGIGSVGLLGPDQDPDDFSPISPYVMVSKFKSQLEFLDRLGDRITKIDTEVLDKVALDIGRAVVASKFFPGTALCSIDMPTCARNERISPVASLADTVTNLDVAVMQAEMEDVLRRVKRLGET